MARLSAQHKPSACSSWQARMAMIMLAALLAVGGWTGCAAEHSSSEHSGMNAEHDRNAALVSMSVGFHKRADLALAEQNREEAKAEMARLLELCFKYNIRTPDAYNVLFDASTRLAQMHLEDNALKQAEEVARRALAREQDAPPSLFRGYLHQTLADVLERKGDPRGAVDEHGEAITIFKHILDARPPSGPSHQENSPTSDTEVEQP